MLLPHTPKLKPDFLKPGFFRSPTAPVPKQAGATNCEDYDKLLDQFTSFAIQRGKECEPPLREEQIQQLSQRIAGLKSRLINNQDDYFSPDQQSLKEPIKQKLTAFMALLQEEKISLSDRLDQVRKLSEQVQQSAEEFSHTVDSALTKLQVLHFEILLDDCSNFLKENAKKINPPLTDSKIKAVVDQFNLLKQRLADEKTNYFSSHKKLMLEAVREYVQIISELLANEDIAIQQRIDATIYFSDAATTCAGGVVSAVLEAIIKLQNYDVGLRGSLVATKVQMIRATILEYASKEHQYRPGDEIHFVNAYFNYMASEIGEDMILDPFTATPSAVIKVQHFEECKRLVLEKINAADMALWLANDFLTKIRQLQAEAHTNSASKHDAYAMYDQLASARRTLKAQFDEVPDNRYVVTKYDVVGNITEVGITKQPTKVARHFLRKFAELGVTEPDQIVTLLKTKGGNRIVMQGNDFLKLNEEGEAVELEWEELTNIDLGDIVQTMKQAAVPENEQKDVLIAMIKYVLQEVREAQLDQPGSQIKTDWLNNIATLYFPTQPDDAVIYKGLLRGDSSIREVAQIAILFNNVDALCDLFSKDSALFGFSRDEAGQTLLMFAAQFGSPETARAILASTMDLEAKDNDGRNALMIAAKAGKADLLNYLISSAELAKVETHQILGLESELDPNTLHKYVQELLCVQDNNGYTVLMHALDLGELPGVLLAYPKTFNIQNMRGIDALMIAAERGLLNSIKQLVVHNANVCAKDKSGFSPLMHAIKNGHTETALFLMECEAVRQPSEFPPDYANIVVRLCVTKGNIDVLDRILSFGFHSPEGKEATVWLAVELGRVDVLNYLVTKHGCKWDLRNNVGQSPVMVAAARRNLPLLKALHRLGADLNAPDAKGNVALRYAVLGNDVEVVRYLVENGALVDSMDNAGTSIFTTALRMKNLEIVKILTPKVEHAVFIDQTENNCTGLMLAASLGHSDIVNYLVEYGSKSGYANSFDTPNANGTTVLMIAAKRGMLDSVKSLVEHGAAINSFDEITFSPLMYALQSGHTNVALYLIERAPQLGPNDQKTILTLTIQKGNVVILDRLINSGFDLQKVRNAFLLAVEYKNIEVIRYLSGWPGVNVEIRNPSGQTALNLAAKMGSLAMLKALHQAGADINAQDNDAKSPLLHSINIRNIDAVHYLVENGANIDQININPNFAVIFARRNLDILKILTTKHAQPFTLANSTNTESGLILAALHDNPEAIKHLISCGANPNAKDKFGVTAMMIAARKGKMEALAALHDAGADINAADQYGNTALYYAVGDSKVQTVRYLVEKGARLDLKNSVGLTAADLAKRNKEFEILKILPQQLPPVPKIEKFQSPSDIRVKPVTNEPQSENRTTALMSAAMAGNYDAVLKLLDSGADVTTKNAKDGKTALQIAIEHKRQDIALLLIQRRPIDDQRYLNSQGSTSPKHTALHAAVATGQIEVVTSLIQAGASTDCRDSLLNTPEETAIKSGNLQIIQLLMSAIPSKVALMRLQSALSTAINFKKEEVATYLVQQCAAKFGNIDKRTIFTPRNLLQAVTENMKAAVELMLKAGADVNSKTPHNDTALIRAVKNGYADIVGLLMEYGADPSITVRGDSALSLAERHPQKDVLLEKLRKITNKKRENEPDERAMNKKRKQGN